MWEGVGGSRRVFKYLRVFIKYCPFTRLVGTHNFFE